MYRGSKSLEAMFNATGTLDSTILVAATQPTSPLAPRTSVLREANLGDPIIQQPTTVISSQAQSSTPLSMTKPMLVAPTSGISSGSEINQSQLVESMPSYSPQYATEQPLATTDPQVTAIPAPDSRGKTESVSNYARDIRASWIILIISCVIAYTLLNHLSKIGSNGKS